LFVWADGLQQLHLSSERRPCYFNSGDGSGLAPSGGPSSAARSFELVHGRPIVVAGLEPGDYLLRISAVERADHGALIENAGGLTGEALIEELRRDLEGSEVRLAASAAPLAITVEGHTRVDVEVPIERSPP
jgi:hypothetical protein